MDRDTTRKILQGYEDLIDQSNALVEEWNAARTQAYGTLSDEDRNLLRFTYWDPLTMTGSVWEVDEVGEGLRIVTAGYDEQTSVNISWAFIEADEEARIEMLRRDFVSQIDSTKTSAQKEAERQEELERSELEELERSELERLASKYGLPS